MADERTVGHPGNGRCRVLPFPGSPRGTSEAGLPVGKGGSDDLAYLLRPPRRSANDSSAPSAMTEWTDEKGQLADSPAPTATEPGLRFRKVALRWPTGPAAQLCASAYRPRQSRRACWIPAG